MIKFINMTMRNFMSYGNQVTTFDFDKPGTTLIMGNNGTGKSAVIDALTYCLFDKPLSGEADKVNKDDLVNVINGKKMEVTVTFKVQNKFYLVHRARKMKAGATGNFVRFYERDNNTKFCDDDEITRDATLHTNQLIEDKLGISFDLFVRIIVFSANYIPFLQLPVKSQTGSNQTQVIEQLFNITSLTLKGDYLKQTIKDNEANFDKLQVDRKYCDREINNYVVQVTNSKRRIAQWDQTYKQNIIDLQLMIDQCVDIDVKHQKTLLAQHLTYSTRLNDFIKEKQQCSSVHLTLSEKIEELKIHLTHLNDETCPYCAQPFHDTKDKVEETTTLLKKYTTDIVDLEEELSLLNGVIEKLQPKIQSISSELVVTSLDQLHDLANKKQRLTDRLEEKHKETNPYAAQLEELQQKQVKPYDMEPINQLQKIIEHQRFLLKLLTQKDSFVRKVLLNKHIPYLNVRLQHYLSLLGLPHKVEFTHKLTAKIAQFNRELRFGALSTGQKSRINLALSMAFRDVLQRLHTAVNLCILDECLDVGLDNEGLHLAARMLKHKSRNEKVTIYIISHRDEVSLSFDHQLLVTQENGFSTITVPPNEDTPDETVPC